MKITGEALNAIEPYFNLNAKIKGLQPFDEFLMGVMVGIFRPELAKDLWDAMVDADVKAGGTIPTAEEVGEVCSTLEQSIYEFANQALTVGGN